MVLAKSENKLKSKKLEAYRPGPRLNLSPVESNINHSLSNELMTEKVEEGDTAKPM